MDDAVMEIGALLDEDWGDIQAVAAILAGAALRDPEIAWSFMADTIALPRRLVEHMLARRSGTDARRAFVTLAWEGGEVRRDLAARAAGLYTHLKPARRFFAREAMIVHHLGPLLAPSCYAPAIAADFADHIRDDIATSDHLFCLSPATRDDVRAYFSVAAERLSVIEANVALDPVSLSAALLGPDGLRCEPYVLVLATPDSGRLMFGHLARDRAFAARYRIVFLGRTQRRAAPAELYATRNDAAIDPSRLLFAGGLSAEARLGLILNAAFCVQPSPFGGDGLAMIEAGALERLVVCPYGATIAGAMSLFFDPTDPDSFASAIDLAERQAGEAPPILALPDLLARAAASPASGYAAVARWVRAL